MSAHTIKLIIGAGKASPSPPVGPALGQRGVKSMDFCKQFNDQTKHYAQSVPLSTKITVLPDKTFKFTIKSPPTSYLLKQVCGLEKGSGRVDVIVGTVTLKHIFHIAEIKSRDEANRGISMESVCRQIIGTARNMGIAVEK